MTKVYLLADRTWHHTTAAFSCHFFSFLGAKKTDDLQRLGPVYTGWP